MKGVVWLNRDEMNAVRHVGILSFSKDHFLLMWSLFSYICPIFWICFLKKRLTFINNYSSILIPGDKRYFVVKKHQEKHFNFLKKSY